MWNASFILAALLAGSAPIAVSLPEAMPGAVVADTGGERGSPPAAAPPTRQAPPPDGRRGATDRGARRAGDQPARGVGAREPVPSDRGAVRPAGAATDAARRGLAPEHVDSLINVANDISPDWAEWLRTRRQTDPEGLRKAIQSQAKQLIALAVIREHNPDLYELKISELRLQHEVGDLGRRYRDAVAEGRSEEAEALLKELRAKATQQVDKSLKSRAAELAELDQQVRELKERLLEDSRNRDARIEELLKSITDSEGGSPLPLAPPSGGAPSGSSAGTGATPADGAPRRSE